MLIARSRHSLYASVRKATLGFKSKMEQHDSKQRALLLNGGAVALEHRKKLAQESLVKTATAVTESIRRTAQLLDAEVAKSTKTVEVLGALCRAARVSPLLTPTLFS